MWGQKPQKKHFLVNNLHNNPLSALQGQSVFQECGCSGVLAGPAFPASLAQPVPQRDLRMYDRGATCLSSEGIKVP